MKLANIMYRTAIGKSEDLILTKEFKIARARLLAKIKDRAREGSVTIIVKANELEGKGFNLRGFLGVEGFTMIDRPQKRVLILWNC